MTNRTKAWLSTTMCIFIPILIGIACKFIFHVQLEIVLTICYLFLLFFLVPSDSFFGDMLDYNAKSLNPTFRPQKKRIIPSIKVEFIQFILVLMALILNLIIWYRNSQ
ncbi:hypothetical protein A5883_003637 [Enterococcus sp. 5B3_DIV0040]|nr:hypothetical protein A5883_003637 [Enterococcus sp. 5B3_DIV0040]